MPTVPTIDHFSAAPAPLPGVRESSVASPELFGAAAAQQSRWGTAALDAGSALSNIAILEQARQNETDVKAADINALRDIHELQHNPETGFMNLQGKAAVDSYPAAVKGIKEISRRSLDSITDPRVRQIAEPVIARRTLSAIDAISRHAGQQRQVFQSQTSESRALMSLQNGADNYADEKGFQSGLQAAYSEAIAQGELHGWDQATTQRQMRKYTDLGYKMRYEAWRLDDPAAAFADFQKTAGSISPTARVQLAHQLFESAAPALAAELNAAGGSGITAQPPGNPLPRGIRNNNPGNLVRSDTSWQGEVQGNDPRYSSFETPEAGIRAMAKTLVNYQDLHGLNTVRRIIARWAPATENDSAAYVSAVAKAIGVKPDQPLDLHDSGTIGPLMKAMIQVENGKQPYTDKQIALGLAAAGDSASVRSSPSPAVGLAYRDSSIPTGNDLVDSLPSDWKLHVLTLARAQASQDMAAARERVKAKTQDAQASYLVNGFAPNSPTEGEFIQAFGQAEGIARYRSLQDVAKLGQQLQTVKTLPGASLEQLREAAKPVPGDGFAERQHNYEILSKAIDQVQQARAQDPIAFALASEYYGLKPLNEQAKKPGGMVQEMANRAAAAPRIAADYGTPPAILTKPEAKALSADLKAAPVEQQKAYLAGMYQSIGDMGLFRQTMQSIAPDNPTMAVAGIYQAQQYRMSDNRDVADLILRGQSILTPNRKEDGSGHEGGRALIKMPEEKLLLSDFNAQTGDAFKGKEQAADLFHQTAKAIYAARAAEEGDYSGNYDSNRWKAAINLATGGIEGHNGAKIVLPYGMPYDKFQNVLAARVADLVKTSPPIAATTRDLVRLPLENVGDGRYLFRRGAGYVVDTSGRPLVVNMGSGR